MLRKQMSDSLMVGVFLAFAGGILDSYSYIWRGQVFATAETGNIVRLSIYLSAGNWAAAGRYLLPTTAFTLGVLAAEGLRRHMERRTVRLHWRQAHLITECAVLLLVALLPLGPADALANILISFTSAVQMESFRTFQGCTAATTMCTGNLRSGTENLYRFLALPDPASGAKAGVYYRLILSFMAGAVACGWLSRLLGRWTVLAAAVPLLIVFFLLFQPGD